MNQVHRYINLPFQIEKPEEFNKEWDTIWHFDLGHDKPYSKLMLQWLEQFNLTCANIDCFYTPPGGGKIPPHTDAHEFNNQIKINITWGPEESEVCWWTSDKAYKFEYQPSPDEGSSHYMNLYRAEEEDCNLVYTAKIDRPSIINVGFLHSTYNPGKTGRHTLCFSVVHKENGSNVTFDQALDIFKNYIDET